MWHKENEYIPDDSRANETGNFRPYRDIGHYEAPYWIVHGRRVSLGCVVAWTELPALPEDPHSMLLPPSGLARQLC